MAVVQQLEREALDAHARGQSWSEFWPTVADRVRQAESCGGDYHALVGKLLHLLLCGNVDGAEPVGDGLDLWFLDDAKPADTGSRARINWRAAGVQPVGTEGKP